MNKVTKTLMLVVLALFLTGCVKVNFEMKVNNDKKVDFEVIYGMDTSVMDSLGGEESENEENDAETDSGVDVDDYKDLAAKGFKVEKYTEKTSDKNIEGVKISKTYPNIDSITKDTAKTIDFVKLFSNEDLSKLDDSQFFSKKGNNYVANFTFDFSSEDSSGMDMSAYASMFDLKYKITLPEKSVSNNATTVSEDGKTLTWNLKYGELNKANFEFAFPTEKNNIILYAAIGGVVLIIIIVVIVVFSKKRSDDEKNEQVNKVTQTTPISDPTIVPVEQPPILQEPTPISKEPEESSIENSNQTQV